MSDGDPGGGADFEPLTSRVDSGVLGLTSAETAVCVSQLNARAAAAQPSTQEKTTGAGCRHLRSSSLQVDVGEPEHKSPCSRGVTTLRSALPGQPLLNHIGGNLAMADEGLCDHILVLDPFREPCERAIKVQVGCLQQKRLTPRIQHSKPGAAAGTCWLRQWNHADQGKNSWGCLES